MRGFSHFKIRPMRIRHVGATHWYMVLSASLLLFGIAIGALCEEISRARGQAYLQYFIRQTLSIHESASFVTIAGYVFLSAIALQALMLFLGFSCIGAPAIFCIPVFKGFLWGSMNAYLYCTLGLRGILVMLLLFWLPQLCEACCLLALITPLLPFSLNLFRTNLLERKPVASVKTGQCLRVFVLTSLTLALNGLCSGLLSSVFAPVLLSTGIG